MVVLMTRQAKGAAQRTLRRAVDVALAILLLVQMCYQLLPDQMCYQLLPEDFHALLGALLMRVVVRGARPIIR